MRPVPAGFGDLLRGSHQRYARVRVLDRYVTGVPSGGTVLEVVGGEVTMDSDADIRAQLDVEVVGRGLFDVDPQGGLGLLTPYGVELHVEVVYPTAVGDAGAVTVPLGYFRVYDVEEPSGPLGAVRVVARDRMSGIVDARLPRPRAYPSDATFGEVVDELVRQVYPAAVIVWDRQVDAGQQLGRRLFEERDRVDLLAAVCTAAGKRWWWDEQGRFRLADPVSPSAPPVWTVDAGADGVMVSVSRSVTREGAYNAVVAQGEGVDDRPPVWAIAVDDDPASPTRWGGPFGKVPTFYTSPLLVNLFRARRASQTLLTSGVGLPYAVNLSTVCNPALEPDDPIAVTYPLPFGSQAVRSERHVLTEVTVPLVADEPQQLTTREQTNVTVRFLDPGEV